MNKKAMYDLTYGLFVISSVRDGRDNACITNTVGQVTSEPNRISVAVNKSNYTCGMIADSGCFTVSVISEKASFDLSAASVSSQEGTWTNSLTSRPAAGRKTER